MKKEIEFKEKTMVSISLPVQLVERIRNAAYWNPGLTFREIVQKSVEEYLPSIENGREYPPRPAKLRTGVL